MRLKELALRGVQVRPDGELVSATGRMIKPYSIKGKRYFKLQHFDKQIRLPYERVRYVLLHPDDEEAYFDNAIYKPHPFKPDVVRIERHTWALMKKYHITLEDFCSLTRHEILLKYGVREIYKL